jgi:hypothetical protein
VGIGMGCYGGGVHFAVDPCSLCGGSLCSSDFGTNQ